MSHFSKRFKRLLDFADWPLPGDRVKIGWRTRRKDLEGKTGVVKWVSGYAVEIDGEVVSGFSPHTLEIVEDD